MKTLKGWPEGQTITQYLQVGDKVDNAMYEHFLNILPPKYHAGGVLQVGGACDTVADEKGVMKNTYLTFTKRSENDSWTFQGECFFCDFTNRNPDLMPQTPETDVQLQKFDVSVSQTRYATVSVEASSREEALDKVSAAVRSDNVAWDEGPLNFSKAVAREPVVYKVKASVLNCKNIETAIKRAKVDLVKQEMHENFGQEYVRAIRDRFNVGLTYSLEDKLNMAELNRFENWCNTFCPGKHKVLMDQSKEDFNMER